MFTCPILPTLLSPQVLEVLEGNVLGKQEELNKLEWVQLQSVDLLDLVLAGVHTNYHPEPRSGNTGDVAMLAGGPRPPSSDRGRSPTPAGMPSVSRKLMQGVLPTGSVTRPLSSSPASGSPQPPPSPHSLTKAKSGRRYSSAGNLKTASSDLWLGPEKARKGGGKTGVVAGNPSRHPVLPVPPGSFPRPKTMHARPLSAQTTGAIPMKKGFTPRI